MENLKAEERTEIQVFHVLGCFTPKHTLPQEGETMKVQTIEMQMKMRREGKGNEN